MAAKIPYKDIGGTILTFGLAAASMYYILNFAIKKTLSDSDSASTNSKNYDDNIKRFSSTRPELSRSLNRREKIIMASVICPQDLDVRFEDVGGLDSITEELREGVLYPLTHPQVFAKQSSLLQAPKGVLLYGPPGCGKTMLAKALAAESSANFINIRMSTILDQWYGEANKLVTAVFSLAKKLEPSIIFIDEIDSFLRERRKTDHEATAMLKAEFMTLWDGLTSEGGIVVIGATNRPNDIDPAILRRMPKRFAISLPDSTQRKKILQTILVDTLLDEKFDFDQIVSKTAGMSGSDLKELCRDAAMVVAKEYIRQSRSGEIDQDEGGDLRPLRNNDFFVGGASQALNPLNYISEDSLIPLDG